MIKPIFFMLQKKTLRHINLCPLLKENITTLSKLYLNIKVLTKSYNIIWGLVIYNIEWTNELRVLRRSYYEF